MNLEKFLKKNDTRKDGIFEFAKDLTLEEFLNTCERGDWILWLFQRINPDSLKELTLAKGHCANIFRHLIKDEKIIKAVDAAIAFGSGKISKEKLDDVCNDALYAIASFSRYYVSDSCDPCYPYSYVIANLVAHVGYSAANAGYYGDTPSPRAVLCIQADAVITWIEELVRYIADYAGNDASFARKEIQKQTASICRKYLPIERWSGVIL